MSRDRQKTIAAAALTLAAALATLEPRVARADASSPCAAKARHPVATNVFRVDRPHIEHAWEVVRLRNFTNATELIQGAIDRAFRAGGGTVRVGKGTYPVRGLRLRSRVTLYLESGASLFGSRDSADFAGVLARDTLEPVTLPDDGFRPRERGWIRDAFAPWNNAIIRIQNAHDVAIIGEPGSFIDGANGFNANGEENYRGVHGVTAFDSTNILYRGFTIQHTGNWALRHQRCTRIVCEKVTILAGHDGFHIRECADARVEDCTIHTGDDAIAGYSNRGVIVRRCDLSSACSAFRFGGTDVLIEDVHAHGPCPYVFRGSLSPQLKRDGAWDPRVVAGRRVMSAVFRYFSDITSPIPDQPGNILVRNCRFENAGRLFKINLGGERWQEGRRLADIRFEHVKATGMELSVVLNSGEDDASGPRLKFSMSDCEIDFNAPQSEVFAVVKADTLAIRNLVVRGAGEPPLVRCWGERPVLRADGIRGAKAEIAEGTGAFRCIR